MADTTLTISTTFSYKNAKGTKSLSALTSRAAAGVSFCQETQTILVTATLLDVGAEVTAADLDAVMIVNLDANNFVSVYNDSGGLNLICVIQPGEGAVVHADGNFIPYLKADTASVQVEFLGTSIAP